ncbi:hypothetical protein SARC_03177 [Sphaeroforma arctica JP610]|uniref:Uncharacterized protein n=1 Tax=Sphaeroforma arctica JP610 TaxID=667725 RepID=A0A0L0G6H5_9EUKA|nr:hypothetical protein SARC_03177 [Sphaeroforma arctica JP610]KNC84610.1 hypothetical protein SARC_03177 [Sphaeroforma arctica JP610]|eukprot:XP_014158512.1 hypothetical protein SARC_03177 [Sphaeroforma arctica JP610]
MGECLVFGDSLALLQKCVEVSDRLAAIELSGAIQPPIQRRPGTSIENALFNGKTVLNRRRSSLGVRAMTSTVKELSDAEKVVTSARASDDVGLIITAMEEIYIESGVGKEEEIEQMKTTHLQLCAAISSLKDKLRQSGGSKLDSIVERKKARGTRDFEILVSEKHKSVQALELELNKAREKVSQLLDERERLNAQLREVLRQENNENKSTTLQKQVKRLEEKCRTETDKVSNMDANLKVLEARASVLPEAMEQLQSQLRQLKADIKAQSDEHAQMVKQNPTLTKLQSEVNQLRHKLKERRTSATVDNNMLQKWESSSLRLLAHSATSQKLPSAIVLLFLSRNGGKMAWTELQSGLQAQLSEMSENEINTTLFRLQGKGLVNIDRTTHPAVVHLL